ncbi:hypothetical protein NDN01_18200 [Sphingomonas sp. QA11]|uniref:hypothetical protein n=1 Tax=Sphingomonas sp. QA11 TaxID=2950605 RepID=UPI0023491244|nr:hypothetical protein [Sphingomonas sp. QA11]WCM25943.1 hypothetical protein NDN01_18200 [Sphingomonas sp. QA11]
MTRGRRAHRLIRLLPGLGGMLAALGVTGDAEARQVGAGQAPAAWIAYAGHVSDAVQARLASDDPIAVRLHNYLDQLPEAGKGDGAVLKIAFWINSKGKVTRIDHGLFAQSQPNDDLDALLVGLDLSAAPPKAMLLPLRLSIRIKPAPRPVPSPAPAAMTIGLRYQ